MPEQCMDKLTMANSIKIKAKFKMICAAAIALLAISIIAYSAYLPTKAWLSEKLIARSWEIAKNTQQPLPPWPWADTTAIAKMTVPSLNKSIVLLKGIDATSLAFSAGVMHQYSQLNTSSPFVVAGHRDTHFSFLDTLKQKDKITIENIDGYKQQYQIYNIEIVDSNKTPLLINADASTLMLITCYPFNALRAGGSLRYVISAELVRNNSGS